MKRFRNINTGITLTEKELEELHIREWTELYNQDEEIIDNETYGCKFEDNMTLDQFIEYKKKYDVDNEFIEVDTILNDVMTFAEASEIWGLGESTLRSAIHSNRFTENIDYKKSGKVWLITKEAMERVYGRLTNK